MMHNKHSKNIKNSGKNEHNEKRSQLERTLNSQKEAAQKDTSPVEKDFSFADRAAVYDEGFAGKGSKKFYNLLLREIDLQPGMTVLDAGCGTGALLSQLAGICGMTGYGIDVEDNMIAEAKKKGLGMDFQIARCDRTPFADQTFDVVVACMAYHHFDNKEGFALEVSRILKPNGVLYIVDPRFPWVIRKTINGVLRLLRIVGAFYTPGEIECRFAPAGFIGDGVAVDGYAQVVKLRKIPNESKNPPGKADDEEKTYG